MGMKNERKHQKITVDCFGCYVCGSCGSFLSPAVVRQILEYIYNEAWIHEMKLLRARQKAIRQGKLGKAHEYQTI